MLIIIEEYHKSYHVKRQKSFENGNFYFKKLEGRATILNYWLKGNPL